MFWLSFKSNVNAQEACLEFIINFALNKGHCYLLIFIKIIKHIATKAITKSTITIPSHFD